MNNFRNKYNGVISAIAEKNNVDLAVACDMLISSIKGHFNICYTAAGILQPYDQYEGVPEDFDYNEAINDYMGAAGIL